MTDKWIIPGLWNAYTYGQRVEQWPGFPEWVYFATKHNGANYWEDANGSWFYLSKTNGSFASSVRDNQKLNWNIYGLFEDFRAGHDRTINSAGWAERVKSPDGVHSYAEIEAVAIREQLYPGDAAEKLRTAIGKLKAAKEAGPYEVRTISSTGGEKGTKAQRMDLIPGDALLAISEVLAWGSKKYSDHNWAKGYEWSKSFAALQRHLNAFWAGEDLDPDSGLPHLSHAGCHVLYLLRFFTDFPEFDDRGPKAKKYNTEQETE